MIEDKKAMTNVSGLILWFVGLVIILAGVWVLFTQTDLNRYVPLGVVVALLLLIIGIAVMATSDRFSLGGPRYDRVERVERTDSPYHRIGTRGAEVHERREVYDDRDRL